MASPAPRVKPSQARSRRRYDEICAAARSVIATGGITACSMASIAAEAGMTPASLYRYFPNVEALLYEVAARQLDDLYEQLDDALSELTSADEARAAMLAALDAYEHAFRNDRAMREVWAGSLSLPSLIELNLHATMRSAALIAERLAAFRSVPLHPERAFLYTHLIGSGVLLLLQAEEVYVAALRDELRQMVVSLLDEHRSDERRRGERRRDERRVVDRRTGVRPDQERRRLDRRSADRRGAPRRARDAAGAGARSTVVPRLPSGDVLERAKAWGA